MHYTITRRVITHEDMSPAEAVSAIDRALSVRNIKPLRELRKSIFSDGVVPSLERIEASDTPVCKTCATYCHYKTTRLRPSKKSPEDEGLQLVDGYACPCCKKENQKALAEGRDKIIHNATILPGEAVPFAQIVSEAIEAQLEDDPEAAFCYDTNYLYYKVLPRLIDRLCKLYHSAASLFQKRLEDARYQRYGRRSLSVWIADIACTLKWHATGENADWYAWVIRQ